MFINKALIKDLLTYIDPIDELHLNFKKIIHQSDPFNFDSVTFSKFIQAAAGVKVMYKKEEHNLISYLNESKK